MELNSPLTDFKGMHLNKSLLKIQKGVKKSAYLEQFIRNTVKYYRNKLFKEKV